MAAPPAGAQSPAQAPPPDAGIEEEVAVELVAPVMRTLANLQEDWLDWLAAHYHGDDETADRELASLLGGCRELGLDRLPALGLGAAAGAVRSAAQGDFERAEKSLAAARQLDPELPEVEFAAARIERLGGSTLAAVGSWLRAVLLLTKASWERVLATGSLLLWATAGLLLTAVFFVVLEISVRGGGVLGDLTRFLGRFLPRPVALLLALGLLVWPLALPGGVLWLVVYWSALVWGYAGRAERVILVGAWALLGGAPLAVAKLGERVRLELTPEVQMVDGLIHGELDGTLFSDLSSLVARLPESVAVTHLLADVNRMFGQWEKARGLYQRVLRDDPENPSVLVDLGACYFQRGDFDQAIEYFRQATPYEQVGAQAYFDLSQAYSETYRFEEARRALRRAQELDDAAVSAWIQEAAETGVVAVGGGLDRADEIRGELLAARRAEGLDAADASLSRRTFVLPVGCAVAALVLQFLGRRRHGAQRSAGHWWRSEWDFMRRVLLPGFAEAEGGRWVRAFVAVAIPVALLTLPLLGLLGYRLPWSHAPGRAQAWLLVGVGLTLYLLVRLVRQFQRGV